MLITMYNFVSCNRVLRVNMKISGNEMKSTYEKEKEGYRKRKSSRGKDGNGHGVIRISGVY